jgi:hypothetical protein
MPRVPLAAALAVAIAAVTACGPAHSAASALAASAKARQGEQAAVKCTASCIPSSGAGQVKLVTSVFTGGAPQKAAARTALGDCLGVPKGKRAAWEARITTDGEHVNWLDKSARDHFLTVTLVADTEMYQGGAR